MIVIAKVVEEEGAQIYTLI